MSQSNEVSKGAMNKGKTIAQPKGALLSENTQTDLEYFSTQPVDGQIYIKKIFGPRNLKFTAENDEHTVFEARYDHYMVDDNGKVRGGWMVVSRVNQEEMQALGAENAPLDCLVVTRPDGKVFTRLEFRLQGADEQMRIFEVSNAVHEDPSVGSEEKGEATVMLELTRGGRPDLSNASIRADHGVVQNLHYAMEGQSDADVFAFASDRWKNSTKFVGRSEAEIVKDARELFVTGTYKADQAAMQDLKQGEKIKETGFKLQGVKGYTIQDGSSITLVGKAEEIKSEAAEPFVTTLHEGGIDVENEDRSTITSERITTKLNSPFIHKDGTAVTAENPLEMLGEYSKVTLIAQGKDVHGDLVWKKVSEILESAGNIKENQIVTEKFEAKTADGGRVEFINKTLGDIDETAPVFETVEEKDDGFGAALVGEVKVAMSDTEPPRVKRSIVADGSADDHAAQDKSVLTSLFVPELGGNSASCEESNSVPPMLDAAVLRSSQLELEHYTAI